MKGRVQANRQTFLELGQRRLWDTAFGDERAVHHQVNVAAQGQTQAQDLFGVVAIGVGRRADGIGRRVRTDHGQGGRAARRWIRIRAVWVAVYSRAVYSRAVRSRAARLVFRAQG